MLFLLLSKLLHCVVHPIELVPRAEHASEAAFAEPSALVELLAVARRPRPAACRAGRMFTTPTSSWISSRIFGDFLCTDCHGRGRSAPTGAMEEGDRHPQAAPWTREIGTLRSHGRGRSAPSFAGYLAWRPFFIEVGHSLCLRVKLVSGVPSLQVAPRRRSGVAYDRYEDCAAVPACDLVIGSQQASKHS